MSESHEISSPDALISDAKIARLNDLITKVVKWLEEADAFLTNDAEVTDSQRIANASIVINDALDNLAPYVEGLKS